MMPIPDPPKLQLRECFSNACRTKHLSLHTERSYWRVIRQFVHYHKANSTDAICEDAPKKFAEFITAEAQRGVAASTQNVAFNALRFLYEEVLGESLGKLPEIKRAIRPQRLPDVPADHEQALRIVNSIPGDVGLCVRLIYGAALRVSDALRIRLKDLDFKRGEILIRASKGDKDRVVGIPQSLREHLIFLKNRREQEHLEDLPRHQGWVWLPNLLGKKNPKLHFDIEWQYLFASQRLSKDPQSGNIGRHHLTPEAIQNALRSACLKLRIKKRITPHSLRHAAAREMERRGSAISEIQKCLGHSDIETTMRYLGAGSGGKPKVMSPLD